MLFAYKNAIIARQQTNHALNLLLARPLCTNKVLLALLLHKLTEGRTEPGVSLSASSDTRLQHTSIIEQLVQDDRLVNLLTCNIPPQQRRSLGSYDRLSVSLFKSFVYRKCRSLFLKQRVRSRNLSKQGKRIGYRKLLSVGCEC